MSKAEKLREQLRKNKLKLSKTIEVAKVAKRVAENGWYITLPANFSKYKNRVRSAEVLPLDHILLETDGPYLSPTPSRNEPANIRYGCESLSLLLYQPIDIIA